MSKFYLERAKTSNVGQSLSEYYSILEKNSGQVKETVSSLRDMQGTSMALVCSTLENISDEILTEAASMKSLSEALQVIIDTYIKAEQSLIQNSTIIIEDRKGSGDGSKGIIGTWIKKLLEYLKQVFHWGETTENPNIVTREEERAHDLYMQNEIFSLLENEEFSKKTWENATIEERKEILKSFMNRVAAIYGVSIVSSINFLNNVPDRTRGYYTHDNRTVSINEEYLSRRDSYQIMNTVIHELRHAYQHSAVDDPSSYNVSPETIRIWEHNLKPENYKSTSKGDTYEEYVSQPVEWDAKNFAKQYSDLTNANPEYVGSWGE